MAKRPVPLYDFAAFGQAIKAARTGRNESRKKVSDEMNISPRYLANIENKGQQPSLQIFYELVTRYDISVDQFFFPDKTAEKSTQRRQLDTLLDSMSDKGISHTGWSFDWNNPSMNYLYHRTFLCPVPYVHKVGIKGKNQKFPRLRKV